MADLVGGAVVGAILNELIFLAKRAYRCKGDCQNLVSTLESIEPLLTSIEQSSDPGNVTCRAWLNDLQSLLLKAKGIVQNCDKDSRCSFLKRIPLSSKIQNIDLCIQRKLLEGNLVTLNIVQRIDRKVTYSSATSSMVDQPPLFEMQQVPFYTVAFEDNPFKNLKDLILSVPLGDTKTIGVKGRGGAGKTLLAKMVNNDEDIKKKYGAGCILWISVEQDVLVSTVYKRMGQFLNDGGVFERDISGRDLGAQRTYLMEAFKQKRALVILDDMWGNTEKNCGMVYWLDICKGDGSTTLITTRDNSVLDRARAMERIEVNLLSKEESWKLFSFHAFQPSIPPSRAVKEIAMEICDECKGLPLALEVIGSALWNKQDERGWKYALSRMKNSESWTNSPAIEDELFHRLKFSYDILSVEAKKCFLYFAAFPGDGRWIPISWLYSIWQAEELFGSRDVEDTLNTGRMNLITLADRSLINLHENGRYAKTHDVLRDLAVRIIRDAKIGEWAYECQFEPGKILETLPRIKETTKRVSFVGTHVLNFDPQLSIEGHNLRVCLLARMTFGNGSGSLNSLPRDFFSCMSNLSYVDLIHWSLEELPESIKELKSLMQLDLSWCKSLKKLPESIKELKLLSHLNLSFCESLKELPQSIKELKFLTHLNLGNCESLKELPESMMELKSLMHLYLCRCASLKELPESIKELKSLKYLDLSGCDSLKKLPESITELRFLRHLNLKGCKILKKLPESIEELKCLTKLDLSECESFKELPESIKKLMFLTYLNLSSCKSLEELPEGIKELKSLEYLDLSGCESLKKLPESIKELELLTHLDLSLCKSLEELPESIKELKLLSHLDLKGCESLKELPESIKELKSLCH